MLVIPDLKAQRFQSDRVLYILCITTKRENKPFPLEIDISCEIFLYNKFFIFWFEFCLKIKLDSCFSCVFMREMRIVYMKF